MQAIPFLPRSLRKKFCPMVAAGAAFLSACASPGIHDTRRDAPACRINAVLYCELEPDVSRGTCQCIRHDDLRDRLRLSIR